MGRWLVTASLIGVAVGLWLELRGDIAEDMDYEGVWWNG